MRASRILRTGALAFALLLWCGPQPPAFAAGEGCDPSIGWTPGQRCWPADAVGVELGGVAKPLQGAIDAGELAPPAPFAGPGTSGLVPDPAASSGRALLDDGTWGDVADPADFGGPGASGLVPDPVSSSGRALLDDGTWGDVAHPADFGSRVTAVSTAGELAACIEAVDFASADTWICLLTEDIQVPDGSGILATNTSLAGPSAPYWPKRVVIDGGDHAIYRAHDTTDATAITILGIVFSNPLHKDTEISVRNLAIQGSEQASAGAELGLHISFAATAGGHIWVNLDKLRIGENGSLGQAGDQPVLIERTGSNAPVLTVDLRDSWLEGDQTQNPLLETVAFTAGGRFTAVGNTIFGRQFAPSWPTEDCLVYQSTRSTYAANNWIACDDRKGGRLLVLAHLYIDQFGTAIVDADQWTIRTSATGFAAYVFDIQCEVYDGTSASINVFSGEGTGGVQIGSTISCTTAGATQDVVGTAVLGPTLLTSGGKVTFDVNGAPVGSPSHIEIRILGVQQTF